jgi:hypothetical protein
MLEAIIQSKPLHYFNPHSSSLPPGERTPSPVGEGWGEGKHKIAISSSLLQITQLIQHEMYG